MVGQMKEMYDLRINRRPNIPVMLFQHLRRAALIRLCHTSELADRALLRRRVGWRHRNRSARVSLKTVLVEDRGR